MATIAKHFAKPVIVLAAVFKFVPTSVAPGFQLHHYGPARDVLQGGDSRIDVINTPLDYIPPEFIHIIITNL